MEKNMNYNNDLYDPPGVAPS